MSLVNKMLRDLDARRAGVSERTGLPAAVTPLAARQGNKNEFSRWAGSVLLLMGFIAAAWYGWTSLQTEGAGAALPAPAHLPAPVATTGNDSSITSASSPTAPAVSAADGHILRMENTLRITGELREKAANSVPKPVDTVVVPPPSPAKSPAAVLHKEAPAAAEAHIEKQLRAPAPSERAETEYQRGLLAQRQDLADEAASRFRAALEEYPEHAAARQKLSALLIEAHHFDEAEEILIQGTELASVRLASTLALARLKVERNQVPAALELLLKNVASGEKSAEYQGFLAALLNRTGRRTEAVMYYQTATRLAPNEARWWAGLGIALEADGKSTEAREAYLTARSLPGLSPELAQYIEQHLR